MRKGHNKSERVLPEIQLKYFKHASEATDHSDEVCAWCGKKDIKIGGGLDAHTPNPKVICEDCAIDRFRQEEGFKSREAAAARRRRIFDVIYLLQELIIDDYLAFSHKTFEGLTEEESNGLLEFSQFVYNAAFTKTDKEKLEGLVHQKTIEQRLRGIIDELDYYKDLWANTESNEEDVHFDDCPLCQMMKEAEQEGRSLSLDELKSGFRKLEKENGIVGGPLLDED